MLVPESSVSDGIFQPVRAARWLLYALIAAAFGGGLACPSSALATCGDYLAHVSPGGASINRSVPPHYDEFGGLESDLPATAESIAGDRGSCPCRHGQCRSLPEHPASPSAPVTAPLQRDHAAILVRLAGDDSDGDRAIALRDALVPGLGHPARIDRPPRGC